MAKKKKTAATNVLAIPDSEKLQPEVPGCPEDPGNNLPESNIISEALNDWQLFKKQQLKQLGVEKFSQVIEP